MQLIYDGVLSGVGGGGLSSFGGFVHGVFDRGGGVLGGFCPTLGQNVLLWTCIWPKRPSQKVRGQSVRGLNDRPP